MLNNIQSTFQIDVFSFELHTLFDHKNANQTNRRISETENLFLRQQVIRRAHFLKKTSTCLLL